MTEPLRILMLDDEPKMGKILSRVLEREGHTVEAHTSARAAIASMAAARFDLLLTDLRMPEMTGLEVMEEAKRTNPEIDVIMMTAYGTVESAVEAMKHGAADYLIKPFHNEELVMLVARVAESRGLKQENKTLKASLTPAFNPDSVIASGPLMREVLKRAGKVAATDSSVLLLGESGVGKEVFASLIHAGGPRRDRPFIKVNCGALPENLLESELFGHVRGAFTGAVETRKGLFQAADGGTILLDEIGEITPALQVKLLRVLQSGEFQRVGDPQTFKVDVRVIAATNQSLEELIEEGRFRSDLYYRLSVVPINIPPLRDRREDIGPLVDHFLARLNARRTGPPVRISREAFDLLLAYHWPGNIRELENAIEHASVLHEGDAILPEDLPMAIQNAGASASPTDPMRSQDMTLDEIERQLLYEALKASGFNHTRAAQKLGITRRTLGYRIEKYGLPRKANQDAEGKLKGELS